MIGSEVQGHPQLHRVLEAKLATEDAASKKQFEETSAQRQVQGSLKGYH